MQLIFYMTPDEESQFTTYIVSKSGYFMPRYWPSYPIPLLAQSTPVQGVGDPMRELMIFNEALYSRELALSEDWKEYWSPGSKFTCATRPGLEFTRPCVEGNQLFPGRLAMEAAMDSFTPPARRSKGYEPHPEAHKKLENFYRACCNHLRRALNKQMTGWYLGADVENYCKIRGLSRASSTHR